MAYLEERDDVHGDDLEDTESHDAKVQGADAEELGRCELVRVLHHQVHDRIHYQRTTQRINQLYTSCCVASLRRWIDGSIGTLHEDDGVLAPGVDWVAQAIVVQQRDREPDDLEGEHRHRQANDAARLDNLIDAVSTIVTTTHVMINKEQQCNLSKATAIARWISRAK